MSDPPPSPDSPPDPPPAPSSDGLGVGIDERREAEHAATLRIRVNLAHLRERIGRIVDPSLVQIVAVTKGQGPEVVGGCLANGLTLIGENYADELVAKASDLRLAGARWTFQGRLQTNKINRLRDHVMLWQTVDSSARADALANRVHGAQVLVQLNLTGDRQRSGIAVADADRLIDHARTAGLDVVGVMGIGPDPDDVGWNERLSIEAFQAAVACADRHGLAVRSLGMSSDLDLALRAGSTMVRIGTALVGGRP